MRTLGLLSLAVPLAALTCAPTSPSETEGEEEPRMFTQQGEKLKDPNSRLIFKFIIFFISLYLDSNQISEILSKRSVLQEQAKDSIYTVFFIYC
jgi:hypothetical protein